MGAVHQSLVDELVYVPNAQANELDWLARAKIGDTEETKSSLCYSGTPGKYSNELTAKQ